MQPEINVPNHTAPDVKTKKSNKTSSFFRFIVKLNATGEMLLKK